MRRQHLEDVLQQGGTMRPEHRAAQDQGGQPGVAAQDGALLLAHGHQVGQPVPGRRAQRVLRARGVAHQVEQLVPGFHVAVQRGRAGAQFRTHPPHRHRVQPAGVGDPDRDSGDLGPAVGTLATAPASSAVVSSFRYDPADPTPSVGGPQLDAQPARPRRNNTLEARADVLVFTSAPLREPLEVIGPVSLRLRARGSHPYFDVFARLCDVDPEDRSWDVCDGLSAWAAPVPRPLPATSPCP